MNSLPTVFLVDDDNAFLKTTSSWLKSAGCFVETHDCAASFLNHYQLGQPGCLLLDIYMPKMSGLKLLAEMRRRRWKIPTIAMTAHGSISDAVKAIKLGALDYVEKPFSSKKALIALVTRAMKSAVFARELREEIEEFGHRLDLLTIRERDVLKLVVDGLSSSEIADRFGSTTATVSTQRAAIMAKLGAESVPSLIRLTLRHSVAVELDPTLAAVIGTRAVEGLNGKANPADSPVRLAKTVSPKRTLRTGASRKKGNSR